MSRSRRAPAAPALVPLPRPDQERRAEKGLDDDIRRLGYLPVVNRDQFLSQMPPQSARFWHRLKTYVGTSVIGTSAGDVNTRLIYQVPQGYSLVILSFKQYWFASGSDANEPDALAAYQDYQNIFGRIATRLLFNESQPYNVLEDVYDPNGGSGVTRKVNGWSRLNTNLLLMGEHPTALYAGNEVEVNVAWEVNEPLNTIPTAVGVELDGILMPTKEYKEFLIRVRRPEE